MSLTIQRKARLVRKARRLCREWFPSIADRTGICVFLSLCVLQVLGPEGIRACLQAGTCSWPRLRPEQDDGNATTLTHYGYVWNPGNEASRLRLASGGLPEMHVWVGIQSTQEVVDLTTDTLPEDCLYRTGMDWPGDRPPPYFWDTGQELPDRVVYAANKEATLLASDFLRQLVKKPRGKQ